MAEGHDACDGQPGALPSSSSPLPSACYSSFQTWLPAGSRLWASPSSAPLLPLRADAVTAASGPRADVVKQGYLGKMERTQKRYFVLRAGSHTGPSRLEWYKNQEKFLAPEKPAGKAALLGSSKQGVIYLRCCLGVSRIGSSRKGHMVTLYAKDQTMVLAMEDQREQDEWYQCVRKLMEEERRDEEQGEEFEEEDDGYCTLPTAAFYKEVWPVTVKARGLGRSKSLAGDARLCLTATSLVLVRVCSSVTVPLLSVRRFGHLDGAFFLELGRSAPNGPGEIWMEARDQGNPAVAQNIHEVIRETVLALRALPDFRRSPTSTSSHPPGPVVSKRSRPKCRDKCPQAQPPSNPDIHSSPKPNRPEPCSPARVDLDSTLSFRTQQSSTSETDSYVEMKTEQSNVSGWELGEEGARQGYVMMSPQLSHTSSMAPDDYVIMSSPHKHNHSALSSSSFSLQTFNGSTSDSCSPLHPSHHRTKEQHLSHWLVTSDQQWEAQKDLSEMSISSTDVTRQTAQTSSPGLGLMPLPDTSGPVQASTNLRPGRSDPLQADEFKPARRRRLLSCLPSCLQAEERS